MWEKFNPDAEWTLVDSPYSGDVFNKLRRCTLYVFEDDDETIYLQVLHPTIHSFKLIDPTIKFKKNKFYEVIVAKNKKNTYDMQDVSDPDNLGKGFQASIVFEN